jgi:hypothetical protein
MKNFVCNYKGNLKYRTGFEYVAQTKNNRPARLMQFRFNTNQSYLLEATDNYMRFHTYDKDGNFGYVTEDGTELEYACYYIPDLQGYAYDKAPFDSNEAYGLVGYNLPEDQAQLKKSADYFKDRSGDKASYVWYGSSGGTEAIRYPEGDLYKAVEPEATGKVLELETGISYEAAKKMHKTQNADVMYFAEQSFAPKKLTRTSADSFNIINESFTGLDLEETGNPASVTFYKGRLWFGGFKKKVTTIKGSNVGEYTIFTVPEKDIKDDDALSLTLTDITDPISWIMGGKRNLIVGNPEGISIVNGGTVDEPITPTAVNADLGNKEGCSASIPTEKDSQMLYIGLDKRKMYAFDYDLISESFVSSDLNLLASKLGKIEETYYKRGGDDLVFCRTSEGQMLALVYNRGENIVGWFPIETKGKVISMCTVTRPDGQDDLFICVWRDGNYYIERLADEVSFTDFYDTDYQNDQNREKYNRLQLEELKGCNYLDNSVRYEDLHTEEIAITENILTCIDDVFTPDMVGHKIVYKTKTGKEKGTMLVKRFLSEGELEVEIESDDVFPISHDQWYVTFNTIGDLDDLEGITQSVVADGGYIGEYKVENGQIVLDREYTSVVVGYGYEGFAKSFNLGGVGNGANMQTMKKRISSFAVRFANSAGFSIGTSLDNLQAVQKFNPQGFYDSTPLLMNGDEFIYGYNDSHDKEKSVYFAQRSPLPCCVTMVEYNINFERL